MTACPCGESARHVVARRRTADGVIVLGWSNGTIGTRFQAFHSKSLDPSVFWRVLDRVELYDRAEVRPFILTERRRFRRRVTRRRPRAVEAA